MKGNAGWLAFENRALGVCVVVSTPGSVPDSLSGLQACDFNSVSFSVSVELETCSHLSVPLGP